MTDTQTSKTDSLNLLIVDNVEINKMVLQHLLEQIGHQITCVSDAQETLSILDTHAADLVLLSGQLLDKEGIELVEAIRRKVPSAGVVLLAASEGKLTDEQRFAGVSARLTMPVSEAAFASVVSQIFGVSESSQQEQLDDVLDLKMLTEYMQLVGAQSLIKGADMMADLMPGYLEELDQARQARDDKATGSHAHKIKGAAGSLGLQRLQKTAALAQHVNEAGWQSGIDGWIQILKEHFQSDLEVLRSWLNSQRV